MLIPMNAVFSKLLDNKPSVKISFIDLVIVNQLSLLGQDIFNVNTSESTATIKEG